MKRIKHIAIVSLVGVLALAGCVKQPDEAVQTPALGNVDVTIRASSVTEVTRTVIDGSHESGSFKSLWEVGNSIGVYVNSGNANLEFTIPQGGIENEVATFEGTLTGVSGEVTINAYYPWSQSAGGNVAAIDCTIPASQIMTRNSYDESADYMVAQPKQATVAGGQLVMDDLKFRYLVSFANVRAKISTASPHPTETVLATEKVISVAFEAPAERSLSGAFKLSASDATVTMPAAQAGDNMVEVAVPSGMTIADLSGWLVTKPFLITNAETLKVIITTESHVITKELNGRDLTFAEGGVKTVNLNIDSNCTITSYTPPVPAAPAALYILGDATEFSAPKAMRKLDANTFEIYTGLKGSKTYGFTDQPDGAIKYSVIGDKIIESGNPIPAAEGVYLIKVDFATGTMSVSAITDVRYNFAPNNSYSADMTYDGNGVWKLDNHIAFDGGDERYRFNYRLAGDEWTWGYVDNDSPNRPDAMTGEYYNIYPRIRTSFGDWNWGYTFKYSTAAYQRMVDIKVIMSPEVSHYYHSIEIIPFTITPSPALTAPTDGYSKDLNEGGNVEFTWQAGSSSDNGLITYDVVFYADNSSQTELSRIAADNNSKDAKATIGFETLNGIANAAGIGMGATGDVYWTVYTRRASDESAAATRHKLSLTRIQGIENIPAQVYITGPASEFGATYKQMKKKETGNAFEIYTSLTDNAGGYAFTNGTDGTAIRYMQNGNKLYEGNANITGTAAGVYRITLDFDSSTIKYEAITAVQHFMCSNQQRTDMSYAGNGVWELKNISVNFPGDNRYFFRVMIDGVENKFGSDWDGRELVNPQDYWIDHYTTAATDSNWQWHWAWKAPSGMNTQPVDIELLMSPDEANYRHTIDFAQ